MPHAVTHVDIKYNERDSIYIMDKITKGFPSINKEIIRGWLRKKYIYQEILILIEKKKTLK